MRAELADAAYDRDQRMPVRVRYFLRISNVGDRINPFLVKGLCGLPARHVRDGDQLHLLGAGSLLSSATPASLVWGAGLMDIDRSPGLAEESNIFAVRGKLSEQALRKAGRLSREIALGDPAILAASILNIVASPQPAFQLGVVAHYVDRLHPSIASLLALPGVRDLNVHLDPIRFLSEMADCRAVVSSSLHGLIFAESLGIPSLWIQVSDQVAGRGFKFRDWFSTTSNPQREPLLLSNAESPDQLVRRAERRPITFSMQDLMTAFPRERLNELMDDQPCRGSIAMRVPQKMVLPVFLISYNRGSMLLRCIKGMSHLRGCIMPIVHDNGSTDQVTLSILDRLASSGIPVYRRPAISSPDELNLVNQSVSEFFAGWCEPTHYAVSDCDIDLSIASPRAINLYIELLTLFRDVGCVGPMLRIQDVPRSYPLYGRVMNRHIEQFWRHAPEWVMTSWGRVAVQKCRIDTTFAVHRPAEPFSRLKSAVRVYEPFEALHCDWYDEVRDAEAFYWQSSNPDISHWNNQFADAMHRDEPLLYKSFRAVRMGSDGLLQETVVNLDGIQPPEG
jgi:hypothetical protein